MKGRFAVITVVILAAVLLVTGPAMARIGDRMKEATGSSGGGASDEGDYSSGDIASDDKDLEGTDLARICFVKKRDGVDVVFIRIPPGMYRSVKARARAKSRGLVRVVLRPRHHLAIEHATGKLPKRVMLRLSADRFEEASGIKGHYVVRPLSQFMRDDPSDADD